ncbi:hypothetical protein [Ruegeria sp. HKCCD8929]|uniref:COG3904 family protein n=1 Tax=Ruegeria sp. HKCCD8929 TaxID=2683006 RepID=UPI001488A5E7|nr:hypothetical protein [Ruegeria sp. HKCCD8929]
MMRSLLVFGMLATFAATTLLAKTWEEAISEVSVLADKYRNYAHSRGTTYAGTLYNSYHIRRHECAILGRMLGKIDEIRHLEEMELPDLAKEPDPHLALITSISLSNWAAVARSILASTEEERSYFWNINCSGAEGISRSAAVGGRPPPTFEFDGTHLVVRGPVEHGYADALIAALVANPEVTDIALGSGGGNVGEAVRAGRAIRERGLRTQLIDNCYSACPLVFLGGAERYLWAGSDRLGFHQISASDVALPAGHEGYKLVSKYASEMGADGQWVVEAMLAAQPNEMYYVPTEDLCDVGVATFVQYVCP